MHIVKINHETFAQIFLSLPGSNHEAHEFGSTSISLEVLDFYIDKKLKELEDKLEAERLGGENDDNFNESIVNHYNFWSSDGRLGPSHVLFDVTSIVGSVKTGFDKLSLSGQHEFSSIRANVAVFKGKWIYEVMLVSKGIMQVGWSTYRCSFSQQQGVGDTRDSYAFDGSRMRKWNLTTNKYGEHWHPGDVIGCAIDLDKGTMDFYRNGKHLGRAFNRVRLGLGFAYFPAVSLGANESLIANFGATPLKYPVKGYQPLEAIPYSNIRKTELLLDWLFAIIPMKMNNDWLPNQFIVNSPNSNLNVNSFLLGNLILRRLGSFLTNKYINEQCLLRKLLICNNSQIIHGLLDLLWALMEKSQIHDCIDHIATSLVNSYHFSQFDDKSSASATVSTTESTSFHTLLDAYHLSSQSSLPSSFCISTQKQYLLVALSLVQHPPTRIYLLNHVLFDKVKFPQLFIGRTVMDDDLLEREIFPNLTLQSLASPDAYKILRSSEIENALTELESLHQMILDTLIFQDELCRVIFLTKFDSFLKETTSSLNPRLISNGLEVPGSSPATLAIFHRLTSLIRVQYESMINVLPISFFVDPCSVSADVCRVGGVITHLNKTYEKEIGRYIETSTTLNPLLKHVYVIIDGLVRLYPTGAHKQLSKYCAIREHLLELADSIDELKKMENAGEENKEVIQNTIQVLEKEFLTRARQMALINSTVLTSSKRADIYWLLKLLLNTLDHASSCSYLFSFIPDYHIESCLNLSYAIRFYFGSTISSKYKGSSTFSGLFNPEQEKEYHELLQQLCVFIASHFGDERIVNADLRESIVQALASLVSNQETLRILESIPQSSRLKMIKSLTAPYENRAWGQSNWILLRLWKGNGFAFKYSSPSNLAFKLNIPNTNREVFSALSNIKPCPSPVFQRELTEYLTSNPDISNSFISSIVNQLNWSFSEFIGMLQEIQNNAQRPEKVFVDARQLKICCTCFDLSISLLRVLEMLASNSHRLLVAAQGNNLITSQLCSTLNQILNRVTVSTGSFEYVIDLDMIGLESINHFPILSAVSGILIALVLKGEPEDCDKAINAIIWDANFQSSSLLFLTGQNLNSSPRPFRFDDFTEVSPQELAQLHQAVNIILTRSHANEISKTVDNINEDDLCTICYADKKTATFVPCGHSSCRACISRHFLKHSDCFFCKATLERAILTDPDSVLFPETK
ncbi:E3 ubiquitin-protein ligase RNF123-like isoform X2 [Panonychus citri]|uniref:E3 ubiquitin-protein ligase RNF123-like isoform X1 n=1 Tax=Panonychus citri TaxID=50023 RepID=UPI0023071F57|nr:E3 ubiquitin-protein ligase RNF123-like isoform X1 [Panonychus citri]XP_053210514.1 E3 ubiquitin-protein ligase RNF123-like isoform X2 [Panonychus citri]